MKKIFLNLIFLTFLLICNLSYAQNNMEDVVYLKNGSIIHGIIIEQIPNQSIKIQTKDKNVFVFKFDEIKKMTKENLPNDNYRNQSNFTETKKSGYINLTEINICPGVGNITLDENETYKVKNNDLSFGFKTVNGYQINEHFSIGLGLGIDKYKNATLLPITLDARATILKGKISPVFNANIGYAVGLADAEGGILFNPSLGIKTYISEKIAFLFNIGYKWQDQKITANNFFDFYVFGDRTPKKNVYFGFITLNTGFSF